uniref:Helicase n=1 Tax=Tanacetum cinerariifolium TaxID=118510 RepID=A0A6L2LTV3_TANCI|nr:helicase [Tanacetum cinerariifolium]
MSLLLQNLQRQGEKKVQSNSTLHRLTNFEFTTLMPPKASALTCTLWTIIPLRKPPLPNNTNAGEKQKAVASTSRHLFNTSELSRSFIKFTYQSGKTRTISQPNILTVLPRSKIQRSDKSLQWHVLFYIFGARIDHAINMRRGLYAFRINRQNYHQIRSLLPAAGFQPRYAQLYFFDMHNEVRNQMSAFLETETGQGVDETTVAGLITMLDNTSAVSKAFRMVRDWCHSLKSVNFELRLLSERISIRQYNAPMVLEVTALITNDFGDSLPSREIVVDSKDGEKASSMKKIPYHTNRGTRKTKRDYVSMKEYYTYVIQQRNGHGNSLLRGGCLYQQYLVDAYMAVEEKRLQWTRNNQDTLRVDLYHNLNDAFTRGDTNTKGLGKQIVLPRTFTGDPEGYKVGTEFMLHGPCGRGAACTVEGKCLKKYPKPFYSETNLDEDGYPVYRRTDSKVQAIKGKFMYDNKYVVPYNRYLLLEYQEHINVEWCNRSKAIKYLFEYLKKGLNHATFVIKENVQKPAHGEHEKVAAVDEIKNDLNCRYLALCEAM